MEGLEGRKESGRGEVRALRSSWALGAVIRILSDVA